MNQRYPGALTDYWIRLHIARIPSPQISRIKPSSRNSIALSKILLISRQSGVSSGLWKTKKIDPFPVRMSYKKAIELGSVCPLFHPVFHLSEFCVYVFLLRPLSVRLICVFRVLSLDCSGSLSIW